MSWWSVIPGLFGPAKELVEVFKPNAESEAQRGHAERLALSAQDLASLQQFAAEFQPRAKSTWWELVHRRSQPPAAPADHAERGRFLRAGAARSPALCPGRARVRADARRLLGAAQHHRRLLLRRPHAPEAPGHGGQRRRARSRPGGTRNPARGARAAARRHAGGRRRRPQSPSIPTRRPSRRCTPNRVIEAWQRQRTLAAQG